MAKNSKSRNDSSATDGKGGGGRANGDKKPPRDNIQGKGTGCSSPSLPLWSWALIGVCAAVGFMMGKTHKEQGTNLLHTLTTNPRSLLSLNSEPQVLTVQVHGSGESVAAGQVQVDPSLFTTLPQFQRHLGALVPGCNTVKCRLFTEQGQEIKGVADLRDKQRVFLVRPGKLFVFPTFEVGHKVVLWDSVTGPDDKPMELVTLSDSPRVFRITNFLTPQDADDLVATSLATTDPEFKLKRSTTGTQRKEISLKRTSENAFDTTSAVAMKLKRRSFELLGIRPYDETWADGLQVLRYNRTNAYVPHHDFFDDGPGHNFDSTGEGTNRFATVLLYLTDVEDGGETVFVHGKPLDGSPMMEEDQALEMVRSQNLTGGLEEGSWEELMVAQCRTRLAIKPKKADALLFYSQHPDGRLDESSLHGACPVFRGTKWAANLWVWNGPRIGYGPAMEGGTQASTGTTSPGSFVAEFSSKVAGVTLYWRKDDQEDMLWGDLKEQQNVNTYEGHVWVIKRGEETVAVYTITKPEDGSNRLVFTYGS